jgi:hypothetical protein
VHPVIVSWTGQSRRLAKDYERLCQTSEALLYIAVTRIMEVLDRTGTWFSRFAGRTGRAGVVTRGGC